MTDDTPTQKDESIAAKTDRLETIIAQLEDGEVSLERAQELHAEGRSLLEELEDKLDINEGEVFDHA
ncbi:exodeoxyribonuclease VII small subunit [Halosimplex aquaticum]|uniref:Exodeoxyribonuclease VII small subunit n=1 Tax=Halosimplex aquaticum TaxID=3026162 RepID=A0ABD5XV46_9EURY|nr:exodeoxyribonuclease VII small subunit [Halosimplex aquaticum]